MNPLWTFRASWRARLSTWRALSVSFSSTADPSWKIPRDERIVEERTLRASGKRRRAFSRACQRRFRPPPRPPSPAAFGSRPGPRATAGSTSSSLSRGSKGPFPKKSRLTFFALTTIELSPHLHIGRRRQINHLGDEPPPAAVGAFRKRRDPNDYDRRGDEENPAHEPACYRACSAGRWVHRLRKEHLPLP